MLAASGACALLLSGCGESKQDAKEPSHSYEVAVTNASFPAKQAVAKAANLRIAVENKSEKTLPNVAVTVNSLTYRAKKPTNLADPERPTWIVYRGPGAIASPPVESEEVTPPGGGQTANTHTWALGRLAPHQVKIFAWKLLPVVSGVKTIHYEVAAGLHGKAKAVLASGESANGSFTVHIAAAPPSTHVNPETGAVSQGAYAAASGPVGAVP